MSTPAAAPAASGASSAPASSPSASTPSSSSASSGTAAPANTAPTSNGAAAPNAESKGTAEAKADAAAAQQAAAHKKAEEARKWKIKVNEAEREVDEGELIRRAQLGYSADERFKQASEMRKAAESLVQALKTNPLEVLTHPDLGINFRELAENYVAKELQREMLPPEQRELEDLRAYKQQREQEEADRRQQEMTQSQQAEYQQHVQRATKEYSEKITTALDSSGLPKTAFTVKRVAELMKGALEKGYELDVQTAVDMVRDGYMTDFRALFSSLKGEPLTKMLGDDVLKEIRQFDLARIRAKLESQQAPADASTPSPVTRQNDSAPKFLKQDEWIESLRKKAGV